MLERLRIVEKYVQGQKSNIFQSLELLKTWFCPNSRVFHNCTSVGGLVELGVEAEWKLMGKMLLIDD
jgi:hypothetical protein